MKKILALFTATILFLCSCSGKMSIEEYSTALEGCSIDLMTLESDMLGLLLKNSQGKEIDTATIDATKEKIDTVYDNFTKLNPPDELADEHNALCAAVPTEKEYMKLVLNSYSDSTITESQLEKMREASDFAAAYDALADELDRYNG